MRKKSEMAKRGTRDIDIMRVQITEAAACMNKKQLLRMQDFMRHVQG